VNSEALFVGASQRGNIVTRLFPANEKGKLLLRANQGTLLANATTHPMLTRRELFSSLRASPAVRTNTIIW